MKEPTLFDNEPSFEQRIETAKFDGDTYDESKDKIRLTGQMKRVFEIMSDGNWWTFKGIQDESYWRYSKHDSEAGISARIRDMRKVRWGGHTVERERRDNGLNAYRLVV